MIQFSDRQLRIPSLSRPVYMITGGMSQFGRAFPGKKTEELCLDAVIMAAEMLGMDWLELKQFIQAGFYGHFADHFGDQLLGEAVIHDRLGLDPLPGIGIKTGGATGGYTMWTTMMAVASGMIDCGLALGWERMDEVPTDEGNHLIACAADKDWETGMGHIYAGYYAPMSTRYWELIAKKDPKFRETLAKIAVKHRGYALNNPFAHGGMKITIEDVLNSPVVSEPLRALDCCLMSVGSACAVFCDETTANEFYNRTGQKPLRVWIGAGTHTLRVADRRPMEIPLLPHETVEMYTGSEHRYPGFTGFLAARMACYFGYRMAGVQNPLEDFDIVELHDAFTISDIQTYEDAGLRPYGQGNDYVESGDCYHTNPHTGQPGKLPSNLSGGLIGNMHAVGATGVMQAVEVALHLWNRHGEIHGDPNRWVAFGKEKPNDWVDLQVQNAHRGMAISHAGVGSHVTCTVLADPDHLFTGKEVVA
ncbi:hypothetical protein JXA05_04230 [Candidatus Peregrinibacteria bacterium]|nr:hypothetical protein [Candidatus Peregrinibacteria bacterium]